MINPYIKADEVSQFIQKVGPDSWIAKVDAENPYVMEVAVLTPQVFVDPTLEQKLYPPVKKIVNGQFQLQSEADGTLLRQLAEHPEKRISIQKIGGKKVYKMFLPIQNNQVIYIAMDYGKMSAPLYRHSLILIIFGLLSLIALFILAARFFNTIYRNIQQIIKQIKRLEVGDFTAQSSVTGGGELSALSDSANTMADAVSRLLKATQEKATMAQKLSVLMETDANQSVEKVYTMSMETTATARESAEEFHELLNQVERGLRGGEDRPAANEALAHLDRIREMTNRHNSDTAEMTITLADLFKSLHNQSSELSDLSDSLLNHLAHFKL
jgi:methyl-accepting chemotaxis protein